MKRAGSFSTVSALILVFLFLVTPLASAQVASTSIPGVSVTGQGRASAPAETATIAIMLSSGDYYKDPAMMEEAASSPTPPASAEETAQPVVDALVAAGIPAADISIITDPSSLYASPYGAPLMVTVRFTIAAPTSARIMELLDAATTAATDAGLYVNMTSALYGVADCATLERSAREDAIADARDQAATQAELLDVSLGGVIASRDDVYGAMAYSGVAQVNGCTLDIVDGSMASVYNAPAFDPSVEPEVAVTINIELTFEIVPDAAATPGS
jgi:uncharacterized protein YggE